MYKWDHRIPTSFYIKNQQNLSNRRASGFTTCFRLLIRIPTLSQKLEDIEAGTVGDDVRLCCIGTLFLDYGVT